MVNEIQTLMLLLAVYGALWLANTVLGVRNSLAKGFNWDWGYFFNGAFKAVLGAFALTVGAGALYAIPIVFNSAGIQIDEATQNAISILSIIGSVGAGIVIYAGKFVENVRRLFDPSNETKLTVKTDKDDPNKGVVSIETRTGDKTVKELLAEEGIKDE